MSVAEAEVQELHLEQPSSLGRDALERFRHNKAAMVGVVVILLLVLIAIFAPLIAPYEPGDQVGPLDTSNPQGPSSQHWMGLDEQGRDQFSRVVYGARLSLLVGLVSVAFGLSIGLILGALAGYFGGWAETLIMRAMDIMLSIPALLLAIGLVTLLGRGLVQIMIAVGITTIPIFARLLRGSILAQRESDYVLAARSLGVPGRRLLTIHILPNALAPLIVQATLAMAVAIIDVAGLSFLGLGPAEPGLPEWGKMLADNASRLDRATHLVIFPGAAVVISVLGLNLIGDGLRESIDPKLRS
ncbi:MAG: ABC transporter permease subunit [Actinobacteria bacterium]|nr:ABC transporter permease subunit [Actinomycetota bacterium]